MKVRATFPGGFARDFSPPTIRVGEWLVPSDPLHFAINNFSHSRLKKVELVDASGPCRVVSFDGELYP